MTKYGDPLGYKNAAQIREVKPNITTEGIVKSASKVNKTVTAGGAIGGAIGLLGGFVTVKDLAQAFSDIRYSRFEVETFKPGTIELDPTDFDVDSEWTINSWESGTWYMFNIRVERNVLYRRRFYLVYAGAIQ
jgi:hypothetical protein